jgi:tetratricopeptide (TPR) repeat protein
MYAGDIDTARKEASLVLEKDPDFFKSYMILSVAYLFDGDTLSARLNYDRMAETGLRGQSLASVGLADIDIFEGRYEEALLRLRPAVDLDRSENFSRGVGTKTVAIAQAMMALDRKDEAISLLDAMPDRRGDGQLVPAAEIYAANGDYGKANEIADRYRKQLRPTARAYAHLIDGINAYYQSEHMIAIEALQKATRSADLWIVRYYLGKAYLGGGYPAEAIAEFEACLERRTEAGGLFFDDVPTWRYTASLNDWKRQASDALNNLSAANQP